MDGFLPKFRAIAALWCCLLGDRDLLAGRYAQAERRIALGLSWSRCAGRSRFALQARLLNSLGVARKYQGAYHRCARAYRLALRLATRRLPADHPLFACLYHNMAGLDHARGCYGPAEALARHGLAIRERALGPRHSDVGRDLAALAAILDGEGRHEEAESMHNRALGIFETGGRSERREIAHTLGNLAACLHIMGRPEALEVARRAASMQIHLLGAGHPEALMTLANTAVIEKGHSEPRSPTDPVRAF
jgi:tetratricopeptide (TPR) repeat protein